MRLGIGLDKFLSIIFVLATSACAPTDAGNPQDSSGGGDSLVKIDTVFSSFTSPGDDFLLAMCLYGLQLEEQDPIDLTGVSALDPSGTVISENFVIEARLFRHVRLFVREGCTSPQFPGSEFSIGVQNGFGSFSINHAKVFYFEGNVTVPPSGGTLVLQVDELVEQMASQVNSNKMIDRLVQNFSYGLSFIPHE